MKKGQIIGLVVAGLIIVGLIIFASTKKFDDSHLRIDGVRVRVEEGALSVSDCDYKNAAQCEKKVKVGNEEVTLSFEFKDFKENGYPKSAVVTLNGKEVLKVNGLEIEKNSYSDYQFFENFNVLNNELISFTHSDGVYETFVTTLYIIDKEGNIVLKEKEIDGMNIKDTVADYLTFDDGLLNVTYAKDINSESVCNLKSDDITEITYTYTAKDGKVTRKKTATKTAKDYIEDNKVECSNE